MSTITETAQHEADRAFTEAARLVAAAYPLPDAEFLTGFADAAERHAIRRADAEQTGEWFGRSIAYAVCGKLCRPSLKHGAYDPGAYPCRRCPDCAWIVAAARGELANELARLVPSNEDRAVLERLMPDPLIAATAAAMVVQAAFGCDDVITEDDPDTMQLLAAITRHAPVILHREECSEGECEDHEAGHCPASAACAACSLQAGSWAGEWEGTYRHECTIPAPCTVLTELAKSAAEMLEEAQREAAAGADWEREQATAGAEPG